MKNLKYLLLLLILVSGCSITKNEQEFDAHIKGVPLPGGINLIDIGFSVKNKQTIGEDTANEVISERIIGTEAGEMPTSTGETSRMGIRPDLGHTRLEPLGNKTPKKQKGKPSPLIPASVIGAVILWLRRKA